MASFQTREEPDGLVVTITDPAALNDFRTSNFRDTLYETIQPLQGPRLALDLTVVDYLSSSGVALLVGLKRRVEAQSGKLVVCGAQPIILDLLRMMHLTQYFTFAGDEREALVLLRPVPTA